jgi:hypothetical protein
LKAINLEPENGMNEASKISFSIKQFGAKSKAPGSVSSLSLSLSLSLCRAHTYADFVVLIEAAGKHF